MLDKFQSLIAPRYPRRYVGRHRALFSLRSISSAIRRTALAIED
jgi:hypothetical protein